MRLCYMWIRARIRTRSPIPDPDTDMGSDLCQDPLLVRGSGSGSATNSVFVRHFKKFIVYLYPVPIFVNNFFI